MEYDGLILAVETSSRIGSVGLALGENLLGEATLSGPMRHSAEVFGAIGNLMSRFSYRPAQIEHVYISNGPGSFTGLRIAAAMAKTMHLTNSAKIVAVDSLGVIAANVTDPPADRIAAILDAKRNQFFIAVYERSDRVDGTSGGTSQLNWNKVAADSLLTAPQFLDKFADPGRPVCLLGDGLVYHKDKFNAEGIRLLDKAYWSPRASNVHLLGRQMALAGEFADPMTLTPKYIRRPEAEEKWQGR